VHFPCRPALRNSERPRSGRSSVADLLAHRAQDDRTDLDIDEDADVHDLPSFLTVFRSGCQTSTPPTPRQTRPSAHTTK